MPILNSNVDYILNTARIIDDRWLQDHNQKAISAEVSKLSESTTVCLVTTDSKLSSEKPPFKRIRKIKNVGTLVVKRLRKMESLFCKVVVLNIMTMYD